MKRLGQWAAGVYGLAWEVRRRAYASGLRRPLAAGARVVSLGNLTVGGAGKTTLALCLARRARERGVAAAIVCRRYRPGPLGRGDEELMFERHGGGTPVFAGRSKLALARAAAASGAALVLVDDGFSHWPLARDLDVVLLDATDLWGGGQWLPAGRLREPRRALQRAGLVIVSRARDPEDATVRIAEARAWAPAAQFAAGRHAIRGVHGLDGAPWSGGGAVRVVTGTGNPEAVAETVREAGFDPVELSAYRDHHWFTPHEVERESRAAIAAGARIVLTTKDAVRWPAGGPANRVGVIEVEWEWLVGGDDAERLIFEGESWNRPMS